MAEDATDQAAVCRMLREALSERRYQRPRELLDAVAKLEDDRVFEGRYGSLAAVVDDVVRRNHDALYEESATYLQSRVVTITLGCVLHATDQIADPELGRCERAQVQQFVEEVMDVVDNEHGLADHDAELRALLAVLETNPDQATAPPWLRAYRRAAGLKSWYDDDAAYAHWLLSLPTGQTRAPRRMCWNAETATVAPDADQWTVAASRYTAAPVPPPFQAVLEGVPNANLAMLLTCTQDNWDELWTVAGWPLRRRCTKAAAAARQLLLDDPDTAADTVERAVLATCYGAASSNAGT